MSYITGLFLIDAPASALNNGQGQDTLGTVKNIRVYNQGDYPYVSAQAYRFWLRTTLEKGGLGWNPSPIYSAGAGKRQQAYTEGDPITYDDDDLLGYMRATKEETVTRVSPLRTSTLVSLGPITLVEDFGVMSRVKKEEGDKEGVLLHSHQFYRTTLKGLFSLDLNAAGTFTNQMRSGYQNLGKDERERAQADGLEYIESLRAYRLPIETRVARVQRLLRGMARIEGGAKQALHYTDVTPAFVIAAVTRGGNHIFNRVVTTDDDGYPAIHTEALRQVGEVYGGDLLSNVYVGRAEGFMDSSHGQLEDIGLTVLHPRQALEQLAVDLENNPGWMD